MILAAGIGTRLLPLTRIRPKPLFPIYDVPLLLRIVMQLQEAGVAEIAVNTHHLDKHIVDFLKKHIPPTLTVTISHEQELIGTGGAIKKVEEFWNDQPFIVTNGDIFHTIDLTAAYQHHLKSGNVATLVVHHYPRYNQVEIDGEGTIVGIRGKKIIETALPTFTRAFTGIHIISPPLLREIPPSCFVDIIALYLQLIARGMKVGGYYVENHYWLDIGTPGDYHLIHRDIYQNKVALSEEYRFPTTESNPFSLREGALFDGYVSVGKKVTIGENCTIKNSIVWDEVEIGDNLVIEGCIIGDRVKVSRSLKNQVVVE